jgi:hypothetical protein
MIPEISEFSYGFALINELVGLTPLTAAPIFPSLIEEGKKGGGYDVRLDLPAIPLYLQFKCAHFMTRGTAKEVKAYKLRLAIPFFRFHISDPSKSDQHALLLELDDGTCDVFYAAPRFHKLLEINDVWAKGAVAANSVFVRPSSIGTLAGKRHSVSYDAHRTFVCSSPRPVKHFEFSSLVEQFSRRLQEDDRPLRSRLPELRSRIDEAWQRGRRNVLSARDHENLALAHELQFPRLESSDRSISGIRPDARSRFGDPALQQLRELADAALHQFDVQVVFLQPRKP